MTEAGEPNLGAEPFGAEWLGERAEEQRRSLPVGEVVLSCSAAPRTGGLGRHGDEIGLALERGGHPGKLLYGGGESVARPLTRGLRQLLRRSPPWRAWADCVAFDRYASRQLPAGEHLIAFNGEAGAQFAAARRSGFTSLSLMAANSHMRNVIARHADARRRYPIEHAYSERLLARNLREYQQADRIYYASDYIRDSFLEQGFPAERLVRFPLTPDARFTVREGRLESPNFEVLYIGTLTVAKGVCLLIDAISRLTHEDLRLTLVGGWGTRGMRRFVERACALDPRIAVSPGDPLPHLRRAALCVHATYEDGFAYAPAEALAAGVPVLVSEDTGMKELIAGPTYGRVLATGDLDALTEAIDAAYRGELFGR
jgi:glycosyltransferase involved in cell wall biosynthesis